jgi:hypothetical protein
MTGSDDTVLDVVSAPTPSSMLFLSPGSPLPRKKLRSSPLITLGGRAMKLTAFTAMAVLLSAGYAFAGGGAPVPEGSQDNAASGRPSAVLNDTECQSVWKLASPNGDTLVGDKAVPYIVNFQMVDTDKDGKISAAEFKTGCGKGWIQSADASTTKDMAPPAKL